MLVETTHLTECEYYSVYSACTRKGGIGEQLQDKARRVFVYRVRALRLAIRSLALSSGSVFAKGRKISLTLAKFS